MVALSPRTCIEMGIELSDEDKTQTLRRGLRPQRTGRQGRRSHRQADREGAGGSDVAPRRRSGRPSAGRSPRKIAVGALRYFMLKYTRNSVIAFDFGEALSFEGETGPYVQYAAVRAAQDPGQARRARRNAAGFSGGADPRSHGPAACRRRLLAAAAGSVEGGCGRRARRHQRRAGARRPLRLPARAGLQQLLSGVPRRSTEPDPEKKTFLLWMTDLFPRATGTHAGRAGNRSAGVHVIASAR